MLPLSLLLKLNLLYASSHLIAYIELAVSILSPDRTSVVDPDPVGSGPFWSDSDPVFLFQTGSGSDLFFTQQLT